MIFVCYSVISPNSLLLRFSSLIVLSFSLQISFLDLTHRTVRFFSKLNRSGPNRVELIALDEPEWSVSVFNNLSHVYQSCVG